MPFYTGLKITAGESVEAQTRKRRVASNLLALRTAIAGHIRAHSSQPEGRGTVKIATWNLREFGGGKYGGRDDEALYYIAEIVAQFDVVALQEVRADIAGYSEFSRLRAILGSDWTFLATDVTDGDPGNGERMVFLYNQRNVGFRGVAGELTLKEGEKIRAAFGERIRLENGLQLALPPGAPSLSGTYAAPIRTTDSGDKKLDADVEIPLPPNSRLELPEGTRLTVVKNTPVTSPERGKADLVIPDQIIAGEHYRLRFPDDSFDDSLRQFARTPFLISFQSGWLKILLCTVHIYYGDENDASKLEQRRREIELLTRALANKARNEFRFDPKTFLGVLGDFNIIGAGHPTLAALESSGFLVPDALKSIPGSNVEHDKTYDQIAFWEPARIQEYARLDVLGAGVFDYYEHVYRLDDEPLYRSEPGNGLKPSSAFKTWRTYKMSDHLPMWIELRNDFAREYLNGIATGDHG